MTLLRLPPHGRRRFLASIGAALAAARLAPGTTATAAAMGRTPLGGALLFHVPWPLDTLDPHDLRDPAAALFGPAVADPLFAFSMGTSPPNPGDASHAPYPALAAAMPTREAGETVVRLREGLLTAHDVPLDARDIVFSIERARARGAVGLLADVPKPLLRKGETLAAVFGSVDPLHLARILSSPLCAIVPRRFDPSAPDATGAFHVTQLGASLVLDRNKRAARGAAFLDRITVLPAPDLQTSLRAFEEQRDDIGWLGMGLHDGRKGASPFELGRAAWIVLSIGPDAGPASVPGAAQRLVDALPPERLAHLGLGRPQPATGDPAWPGPPTELLVESGSPHLREVARAIAPILSNPGHEVAVTEITRAELASRRARGRATLAVELVRPLGNGPHHLLIALATAEDPARGRDVARTPHHGAIAPARTMTDLLRIGVIGDVRVAGGVAAEWALARSPSGEGWDLGASYRRGARKAT